MDIDIDASSHKRQVIHEALEQYFRSIGGDIVKVCTFKTETSKSAILTSFRGLGLNNDEASYVASLVPNERGQLWSIEDCYYGNEEKERKPIAEFKNAVDKHPRLLETMLSLAGIISARGVHPCGILVVNKDISNWNACMKAPNGDLTTQYSLGDSEATGLIKYDLLSTKAEAIIQTALELLIEAGHIKRNKTLRDTYNQSIHPDVLDYVSKDMWDVLNRGELIQAFQMDGAVGEQAVKMIQPTDVLQVSQANTVMRLSTDDEEQPLERYARYKHDLEEWYKDMRNYGLTQEEIEILETHLLHDFGVCGTQESLMAMTLDGRISGFTVPEANAIRKVIAKKKMKDIPKIKKLFYDKGIALGNREVFLNYIWDEQFSLQLG